MALSLEKFARNGTCSVATVILCCVAATLPALYFTGLRSTSDIAVLISFAQDVQNAVASGDLSPGWSNDVTGYGSVGLRFYPPVSFYFLAALGTLPLSWYHTIWAFIVFWHAFAALGVFFFARDLGGIQYGLLAGVLYSVIPFRIMEVFQFSLLAEFAAAGFVAFAFFFIGRVCRERNWGYIVGLAVSIAGIILTHLPTTIFAAAGLALYASLVVDLRFQGIRQKLLRLSLSACLGTSLSAFYWVRIVTELGWVAHAEHRYASKFDQWLFPFGFSAAAEDINFALARNLNVAVLILIALITPYFVFLVGRWRTEPSAGKRITMAITVTTLFGLFMMSQLSLWLWKTLPILHSVQFPWRLMGVISIASVVSFTSSLSIYAGRNKQRTAVAMLIVACLFTMMLAYDLRRSYVRPKVISSAEFDEVLANTKRDAETNFAAWWPVWARGGALGQVEHVVAGGRYITVERWEVEERVVEVAEGSAATAKFATYFYPRWNAQVNGREAPITPDEQGLMTIELTSQKSTIVLRFCESPAQTAATWISLMTLPILAWLALRRSRSVG